MTAPALPVPVRIAHSLRCPFVPAILEELGRAGDYLGAVWHQLEPSVETAGFLGSALYMADMALEGVEDVYEPLLRRESLLADSMSEADLDQLVSVLDVFHRMQPQLLLLVAALAEAWDRQRVGGRGRAEPREPSEHEARHMATTVEFASATAGPLAAVAEALQLDTPPELYRAVAVWPAYLEAAWDELQHLAAYPGFRRRGRALYYYARSSSRFLAQPLEGSRERLIERGVDGADLEAARAAIDGALPALATMMMHCTAMRVGLGLNAREVVQRE